MTDESLDSFCRAQEMDSLRSSEREEIRRKILAYYLEHPDRDELYEYLSTIHYADFIRADKRALMQLLTQEGMYEQAFSLLETYGAELIDIACLVRICSQTVLATEYEENIVLLDYCYRCFQYGKYDDNILTYLLMYYDGPIEEMKRLWNVGHQNELDTLTLEEKILSLLVFTRTGSAGTERIFASYQSKLGRRKLCKAYLMLKSYEYFVQNLPVSDLVFTHLEQMLKEGGELEDVCKLALLQYYAGLPSLKGKRRETAAELIEEYNSRNMQFAFFTRFDEELVQMCQLEDKVFLEYATNPEHKVYLYYRMKDVEEEYHKEAMKDCFEGIFVREFVLFDTERLECYMEEYDGETLVTRSDLRTMTAAETGERLKDRYAMISRMSRSAREENWEQLEADLDTYYQTGYLTEEIFTLI